MAYGLNKERALKNSTPIFVTIPKDQTINYPQSSMNMQHFLAVRYREIVGDFDWTESFDFFVLSLVVGIIDDNFWEKSILDTVTRLHSFTIVQHAPAHPDSYSSWNTSTCKEKRSAERNEWQTQLKSEESKNLVDSSRLDGRPAGSLSPVEPWATGTAVAQERPNWRQQWGGEKREMKSQQLIPDSALCWLTITTRCTAQSRTVLYSEVLYGQTPQL